MKVEYLYARSIGRTPEVDEALRLAIEATDPSLTVDYVEVDGSEDARAKRFLGSPTIRIDGVDVEYGEREPDEYQAGVRYYNSPQGWKPFPHARMIASAILEAQERQRGQR